jgi:hypothetical protein
MMESQELKGGFMSCPSKSSGLACETKAPRIDVNDILDAFVVRGGLDLNLVKEERQISIDKRDCCYSFWFRDGRAFQAWTYWIEEDHVMKQYFWLEVGLGRVTDQNHAAVLQWASDKSRSWPSPFRIVVSDGVAILVVRALIAGLTPEYLQDVVDSSDGISQQVYAELRRDFGMPSLLDTVRAEGETSRLH